MSAERDTLPRERAEVLGAAEVRSPDESVVSVAPPGTILELIDNYVRSPKPDMDTVERMFALQERMLAKEAETAFNAAMNLAQQEIQPVARATENKVTHSFYAKLEAVDAAIRPIYLKHGFSLSDSDAPPLVPGNIRIECRCAHVGGHTERYGREAAPDTLGPKGSPTKTALHGAASTETFLRRYIRCGIFNVVFKDMDDDGIGGTLDSAQVAEVIKRMTEAKVGPKFLKYMKAQSVEEAGSVEAAVGTILQRDYRKALGTLEEQLTKTQGKTE